MRSRNVLLALLLAATFAAPTYGQLFAGLFAQRNQQPTQCYMMPSGFNAAYGGSFMRPQPQPMHAGGVDLIRLMYYINDLEAQNRIADNTAGVVNELERLNDSLDQDAGQLRDAMFESQMLRALIDMKNGNGQPAPVQVQPVPQQQPTTLIVPQAMPAVPTPTTSLMRSTNGRVYYLRR